MRKILLFILMMSCSLAPLIAEQDNSQSGDNTGTERTSKAIEAKNLKIRRSPDREHYDVIVVYDETEVNVYFSEDFGLASYQLTNLYTGAVISDVVDTSSNDYVTIPIQFSNPNSLDFYIEFEDGSWCHLCF